jgi:hypothetical protein
VHRLTLWCEANEEKSNRRNDQQDLPDHGKQCDEWIATEEQKIHSRS